MTLDQAALKELHELDADGSSGVLAHIINTYLDESPALIQRINAALAANDSATFMRETHSLKASSMSLGATDVANIASDLEMASKSGVPANMDKIKSDAMIQTGRWLELPDWVEGGTPTVELH